MDVMEPRTEAGRALFSRLWAVNDYDRASQIIATVAHDIRAIEEQAASPDWSNTVDRTGIDYTCPHDLDLRLHPRCYLCTPEKEPE